VVRLGIETDVNVSELTEYKVTKVDIWCPPNTSIQGGNVTI